MEKIHKICAASLKYDLVCVKIAWLHLWQVFDAPPSQNAASLRAKKIEKYFFKDKLKPQLHGIVSHATIHQCAKFGRNIMKHDLGMVQTTYFDLKPIDVHASWTSL